MNELDCLQNTPFEDNDLINQAMNGEKLDMEMYAWLGADILKLTYIKSALKQGKDPYAVADFYGVTMAGMRKFILDKQNEPSN